MLKLLKKASRIELISLLSKGFNGLPITNLGDKTLLCNVLESYGVEKSLWMARQL